MSPQRNISLAVSNLTCIFASVFFATGFPALDILLGDWGIISVVLVRNALAFSLILLLWLITEGYKNLYKAKWLKGFIIGASGFGLGSLLLVVSQFLTSTFIAALAAALMPIAAITLEIFFDKRQVTVTFFIGLTFVIFGSIIILGENIFDVQFSMGLLIGLISVTFFAWGSRASVKYLPNESTLGRTSTTTFGMFGFSFLVYLVFAYFNFGATGIPLITEDHVKLLIVYSCFGLAISQILWIKGVQKLGIGIASLHLNITPFYVMIILFLMGYEWLWTQALGAAIIICGISLTQLNYEKSD